MKRTSTQHDINNNTVIKYGDRVIHTRGTTQKSPVFIEIVCSEIVCLHVPSYIYTSSKKYVNGQWRDYNDYAFEPQYYLYQLHQKERV